MALAKVARHATRGKLLTMPKLPYAEDINYWKTGTSSPDTWLDKAIAEIRGAGGKVIGRAFGEDMTTGRSAYMVQFTLEGENFKLVWPVLPTRGGNGRAAQIQAATMLYHDTKARCISAKVLGGKAAFFNFLQLPDGRNASEVATPELINHLPAMFKLLPGR